MDARKPSRRITLGVAAALALLATPALAGHKHRGVLVVPSPAPVVYAAPTVYAAPVTTTVVESAPVVVQSAPAVVATPVPTAYVVPRRALRPLRRSRAMYAAPVVVAPAAPVIVSGW